jgi:hypothetical protein
MYIRVYPQASHFSLATVCTVLYRPVFTSVPMVYILYTKKLKHYSFLRFSASFHFLLLLYVKNFSHANHLCLTFSLLFPQNSFFYSFLTFFFTHNFFRLKRYVFQKHPFFFTSNDVPALWCGPPIERSQRQEYRPLVLSWRRGCERGHDMYYKNCKEHTVPPGLIHCCIKGYQLNYSRPGRV